MALLAFWDGLGSKVLTGKAPLNITVCLHLIALSQFLFSSPCPLPFSLWLPMLPQCNTVLILQLIPGIGNTAPSLSFFLGFLQNFYYLSPSQNFLLSLVMAEDIPQIIFFPFNPMGKWLAIIHAFIQCAFYLTSYMCHAV